MSQIYDWLRQAKAKNYAYLLVVTDKLGWQDFPVMCKNADECKAYYEKYTNDSRFYKIMEIYDLSKNLEEQLLSRLAWNLPA